MLNQALETYNYYRDPRVQAAMFSTCWKIVHQEAKVAVASLDSEWVYENIYVVRIESIVDKSIDDESDLTQTYRDLRSETELRRTAYEAAKEAVYSKSRNVSDEKRKHLEDLYQSFRHAGEVEGEEYTKLYNMAASQNELTAVLGELGINSFHNEEDSHKFCIRVPVKFVICSMCDGSGKVVNPSIDCGGISSDDFDEDPDFEEDYLSGRYDQVCPSCHGCRVQADPQFPAWLEVKINDYNDNQWDLINETCAERSMGA